MTTWLKLFHCPWITDRPYSVWGFGMGSRNEGISKGRCSCADGIIS